MKSLIIGMGIGQLYKAVLLEMGHQVITVDINPAAKADFYDYVSAYIEHSHFDTVHICTPNYTHLNMARNVANYGAKIVFVEKPGVDNSDLWNQLIRDFPGTKFMMVKNNQYRDEIKRFKELADQAEIVNITWNNSNRIPSPGSWFTTRELAFGGVSRDLIPHMLSYYCKLTNFREGLQLSANAKQNWNLDTVDSTDYGTVNKNGTYDVDDFCRLEYQNNNTKWVLTANWKTDELSDISISFGLKGSAVRFELGLCPELAYRKMLTEAIGNLNNIDYWLTQQDQDVWIHQQIENL